MTSENIEVKQKRKLFLPVLMFVILVLVGLLALLPSIMSMDIFRRIVEDNVNATGIGRLSIDSWSLSWFSGNSVRGLTFADKKGVKLNVKEIKMSEGLAGLIGRKMDFGTIVISSPEVSVVAAQKDVPEKTRPVPVHKDKNAQKDNKDEPPASPVTTVPASVSPKPAASAKMPVDITGAIKIENGKASVTAPGTDRKYEFEKINCVVAISSLNSPVNIEAGLSQVGGGAFRVGGSAKILEDGIFDPSRVTADITAEIASLDLEPFAVMASSAANVPSIKGMLDTRLSLKVQGVDKISADGTVSLSNILLAGGPFGSDKPKMDSSKLEFSILVNNKNISIRSFSLKSPFLTATASGELVDKGAKYPVGNIVMNARLDIPGLAAQMPATLRIEKGTLISKGDLSAKAEVQSAGDSLSCLVDVKLVDVEAKSDGRIMTLGHPVQLESKVVLMADGPRIEKCLLSSSFANMSGRGDLRDMQVTLNADIALAMEEARKFIALGKLSAAGKISAVSRIQSASVTERKITGRMVLEDLKVAGLAPSPFVMDSARAGVDMVLKTTADGKVAEVSVLKMSVDSAPLSAKADIARIVPEKRTENVDIQGIELKIQADIKKLFALGRSMGLVQADNDGSGIINVIANGGMQKGLFVMDPIAIDAANVKFSAKNKKLSEPEVLIKCSIEADMVHRNFKMTGLNTIISAGTVNVPLLAVVDWESKFPAISGSGKVKFSLEKLVTQMSDFLSLPPGSSVSGSLDSEFKINRMKNVQSLNIETVVNKLKIKPAAGLTVAEPNITLTISSDQDNISGDIAIKKIKFDSSMLALSAEGYLKDLKKEKTLLLNGLMTCDFKRIGEIVTALGGTPVEMEGKRETKFHLNTSLAESDWKKMLKKTDANAGLYLSKVKAFGMEITGLEFSVSAAKGLVKTDISTKVNEGDLKVMPEVNAVMEPAFLVIADNSQVLRNVKITEGMMSDLIGRVHPVLRGCVVSSGQTDLILRKCYVPLDDKLKDKISVEGDFILRNVVLVPGGFLKTLLDVSSLDVKPLSIPNEVISFVCRNGKLEPSPLTIGNKDYKITFSGYVTLDGMVKYIAEVPVTEKLVGKDAFKYLENVTVKVPIEGPVAKPVISRDAIKSATSGLVKDAAKNAIKEEGGKLLKDVLKKKGGSLLNDILK